MKSIARLLVQRRTAVLLALVPLTLGLAWAGAHLKFDFTPKAIYAGDGDLLEYVDAFSEVFGRDDDLLLAIVEDEREDAPDVLAEGVLDWTSVFTDVATGVDGVARTVSLATVEVPAPGAGLGALELESLLDPDLPYPEARSRLEAWLGREPMLRESFLSTDGRWMAIVLQLGKEAGDVEVTTRVLNDLKASLETHPPPDGYRVLFAGLPALRARVVADLKREQLIRLPVIAIVFFLVLLVAYRRLPVVLLPLIAVGVGLVWTTGALVLTGHALNIISNILPVLLFTIGTANCVHVLNRYGEESARGPSSEAAATRTVRHMAVACLLTYLTTAIGFLSLLAARSRVLREVGLETALGLALLYVATIVVLGAMLAYVRPRVLPRGKAAPIWSMGRITGAAGAAVARHPLPILVASLLLIAASAWGATGLCVNCRLLETYDPDHPFTTLTLGVEKRLGGVLSLDLDLNADDADAFLAPDVSTRLDELTAFAADQDAVIRARAFPQIHAAVLVSGGFTPLAEGADTALAQARVTFAHGLCTRLAPLVGYRRYLSEDGLRARVEVRVEDAGSRRLLTLADVIEREAARLFPAGDPIRVRMTGHAYVYAAAMDHFVRDMLWSMLGAAVVIFAVIGLLFRSLRFGLISVLPNLTPLVLSLGYMRLRGYEINTSSAIVFAISLGVAVDNTIHFLARFREEVAKDGSTAGAVERTLQGAGRAMVLTSILIVLGLAVLHTSDFVPTRRFAEITSVTMAAALLGDLLLLPACLRLFSVGARSERRG